MNHATLLLPQFNVLLTFISYIKYVTIYTPFGHVEFHFCFRWQLPIINNAFKMRETLYIQILIEE